MTGMNRLSHQRTPLLSDTLSKFADDLLQSNSSRFGLVSPYPETQALRFSEQQNNDSRNGTEMQKLQHRIGSNAGKD